MSFFVFELLFKAPVEEERYVGVFFGFWGKFEEDRDELLGEI